MGVARAIAWCVLVGTLAACDVSGFVEGFKASFGKSFDAEFDKSFAKEFVTSCTDSAVKQGAPQAAASGMCQCLSTELLAGNERMTLAKAAMSPEGQEFQGMLDKAVQSCQLKAAAPLGAPTAVTAVPAAPAPATPAPPTAPPAPEAPSPK